MIQETAVYGKTQHKCPKEESALDKTLDPDNIMTKVYAVLESIGFDCLQLSDARDEATVLFLKSYVKYRQGEIWQDINKEFLAIKMKPTAPDRYEIVSV